MSAIGTYGAFVMAMERVERRLRSVTAALDAAGIRYAVLGGNAVAAWVARVDPAATRTTKDVDLLVDRANLDGVSAVMEQLGFTRQDLRQLILFIDPAEPSRMSGVRLVWAGQKVRPSYAEPAPSLDETIRGSDGFLLLGLPALLRMKLTSLRDVDRVHVADLVRVGLVTAQMRQSLSPELRQRLASVEAGMDE